MCGYYDEDESKPVGRYDEDDYENEIRQAAITQELRRCWDMSANGLCEVTFENKEDAQDEYEFLCDYVDNLYYIGAPIYEQVADGIKLSFMAEPVEIPTEPNAHLL